MYGNNSSFMIKHKNMDIISDGKKIYNVIHNIREINITKYSNNNLWNPINIFKNLLNRLNSRTISYDKDYILVEFLISDLNKEYKFFYKRNFYGFRGDEFDPKDVKIVFEGGSTGNQRFTSQKSNRV